MNIGQFAIIISGILLAGILLLWLFPYLESLIFGIPPHKIFRSHKRATEILKLKTQLLRDFKVLYHKFLDDMVHMNEAAKKMDVYFMTAVLKDERHLRWQMRWLEVKDTVLSLLWYLNFGPD